MADEMVQHAYQWQFMGNHPLSGKLMHIGAVAHLPEFVGENLVKEGLVFRVPDGFADSDGRTAEPSVLVGINVDEKDFLLTEQIKELREGSGPKAAKK